MKPRAVIIFYILAVYVFTSFTWWSYLLLKKNADAFREKTTYEKMKHDADFNLPDDSRAYFTSPEYLELEKRFNRQKWMITGEGLVFLILLSVGSFRLWRTFRKEILLARQQNNFLLSITHELKSPLASMKLSLQTLLMRVSLEEKFRKLVENSVEDVDRLSSLVDNILYAARMEDAAFSLNVEMENISNITNSILDKVETVHSENVTLKRRIGENILLETERNAFASVVQNLVENAIKYSTDKSTVEISLAHAEDNITLEVKDQGPGIPLEERENVFKKFYRIGNEETRYAKGTGLGLFIVKRIADLHNGTIEIGDNNPKGTIIRIFFPARINPNA